MKTHAARAEAVLSMFPELPSVLAKLDAAGVPYAIGGSSALYIQGNDRLPRDVDIMFTDDDHDKADAVFNLTSTVVERPYVTIHKSTPVEDGSIGFLSHYVVIADGRKYHYPPTHKVGVQWQGKQIDLIPAEKIVAIKLIGKREHHQDMIDAQALLKRPDFSYEAFWEVVDLLDARDAVSLLLKP